MLLVELANRVQAKYLSPGRRELMQAVGPDPPPDHREAKSDGAESCQRSLFTIVAGLRRADRETV
ncbi:MAG: hypothetical protein ACR2RB_20425 [Gammaproteobacteria bacterium]